MAFPVVLCNHAIVLAPNDLGNGFCYCRSPSRAQLIDFSKKSLAELSFASRRRRVSTTLATICWFNAVRLRLGAETPQDVQRILEPINEDYEDPQVARRRWRDYRSGVHSPSAQTIALAERHCPGTTQVLQSPLWDSLRLDRSTAKVGPALLGRTCPEGDELLSSMFGSAGGLSNNRYWLKKRCCAVLQVGNLESLGVLTICLRLAGEAKHIHTALTFYHAATRCLLALGPWFVQHGIAQAIADCYEYVLLPECCPNQVAGRLCFCSSYYLQSIETLDRIRSRVEHERGRALDSTELAHIIWTEL